jgi:hypothetical protein
LSDKHSANLSRTAWCVPANLSLFAETVTMPAREANRELMADLLVVRADDYHDATSRRRLLPSVKDGGCERQHDNRSEGESSCRATHGWAAAGATTERISAAKFLEARSTAVFQCSLGFALG